MDADALNPVLHVAYSYACQLAILGPDDRLERIVAAHDSGLVVNPLAFEGQVEGGVAMGIGYRAHGRLPPRGLRAHRPLRPARPPARGGRPARGDHHRPQGRAGKRRVRSEGIGEISTIPTAAAIAGAYFARDGRLRTRLPLERTPYRGAKSG